MHAIEKQVIEKVLDESFERAYTLSVFDGEEWTVKRSANKEEVLGALGTVDLDLVNVYDATGSRLGFIRFVYGNEPYYVINDHSASPEVCDLLQKVWDLVDELEATHG